MPWLPSFPGWTGTVQRGDHTLAGEGVDALAIASAGPLAGSGAPARARRAAVTCLASSDQRFLEKWKSRLRSGAGLEYGRYVRARPEPDEPVAGAGVAAQADDAVGEDPAGEKGPQLAFDEARHRPLAGPGVREEAFEFGLHHAVEDALLGAAAGVEAVARGARRCALGGKRRNLAMHGRRDCQSRTTREASSRRSPRLAASAVWRRVLLRGVDEGSRTPGGRSRKKLARFL